MILPRWEDVVKRPIQRLPFSLHRRGERRKGSRPPWLKVKAPTLATEWKDTWMGINFGY